MKLLLIYVAYTVCMYHRFVIVIVYSNYQSGLF